jgi:lipid-A-disaccharide synthase
VSADDRDTHVFLVAGEESGDRLGAGLMRALRASTPGAIRFSGVGGAQMAEEGLVRAVARAPTAIIGFAAIPALALHYWQLIRQTSAAAVAANPDVLVIIDSPEFTHRVAKRVRRAAKHIPIVDYGAPSVWAWRPGRARVMRGYIDQIIALLPFEPAAFARLNGPPCAFAGHPASEHMGALRPNEVEARRRMQSPPIVLLMPGSRRGEIARMLELFRSAAERIASQIGEVEFVVPAVPAMANILRRQVSSWRANVRIVTEPNERDAAFRNARLAVVKSGTSTLEVAFADIPMVTTYKVSPIEAFVARRLLKVSSVILVNLVLGEQVVPELLQEDATADNIVAAAMPLFQDGAERKRQLDAFARLDAIMQVDEQTPSMRAAAIVLDQVRK